MTVRPSWDGDAMAYAKAHVSIGVLRVDPEGRIWREKIFAGGRYRDVEPRRAENVGGKGYLRVSLAKPGGKLAIVMAHSLVFELLVGPIPDGLEVNHKDLDKTNNRPDNLEVVTGAQNVQHAYTHGRNKAWAFSTSKTEWRPGRVILSDRQLQQAREMRASGALLREIADRLGISTTHAHRITGGSK